MLPTASDYAGLVAGFRWNIPARYNIAADVCDRWAAAEPDRIALIHRLHDGRHETHSYEDLRRAANRLANVLRGLGVGRADRVALMLPQSPQTAFSHIAVYKLGAIAVPLASLFGVDALRYRLDNCDAKVLVTTAAGAEKISEIRGELPNLRHVITIGGPTEGSLGLEDLMERARDAFETFDSVPDDPALMIYTSGTTGPPKGALHGHRVLLGHLPGVQMPHEFFPQPNDLFWTPADWAWAGGLLNVLLPSLHFGVPVVAGPAEKFDPERAFELMADCGVRNTFIPPTALKMLRTMENPRAKYDLKLRTIGSGGESLGRETFEWAREALGITVNEFYGQTECNLVLSSCAAAGVSRAGAIGKPVPGHEVAIIDAEGNVVEAETEGQIAVRRPDPVMFLEYWKRPEATRDKFVGDWMLTGDQGLMDGDGYVHFVGRDDDVITSAGYRIGPGEIEDCLLSHPSVALAAAIGKPDKLRTEIVKAFIVLKDPDARSEALEREIQSYVRERLAAHEYPREIAFVDSLPMTTTGKVIRRILRDEAKAEAEG
ncbi:acyl-CoA synthetase [Breoghania sp. L-A4]|uniref:acyl-CoA synthetase n=1 Tax=Breoghania sp. L-A4 TaxID=2304600 RepID=UPI000E35E3A4|nr:acyl-CoA synthetase [Breoghania sp. L-A4]AXS42298.1 AMP-dependent synthetase [Breoghania sp. L-A4]